MDAVNVNHETLLELGLKNQSLTTQWIKVACKLHGRIAENNYQLSVVVNKGAQRNKDVEFNFVENDGKIEKYLNSMRKLTTAINNEARKHKYPAVIPSISKISDEDLQELLYRYTRKWIKGE